MLAIKLSVIMCFLKVAQVAGEQSNVHMTRLSGDGEGCIYYFFRCEVTGSSRQVWKVNGDEKLRLWANSPDKALILVDSLKFLVEEVISADNIASDTTFISYMWFDDPSVFDHNMDVVCESAESESHVSLAGFGGGCKSYDMQPGKETSSSAVDLVCYTPGVTYHFRCEVRESSRQVWKLSGNEKLRVVHTTRAPSFHEDDFVNVFVEDIIHGNTASETSYVSYLWIYSLDHERPTNISCESSTHQFTIKFDECPTIETTGTGTEVTVQAAGESFDGPVNDGVSGVAEMSTFIIFGLLFILLLFTT